MNARPRTAMATSTGWAGALAPARGHPSGTPVPAAQTTARATLSPPPEETQQGQPGDDPAGLQEEEAEEMAIRNILTTDGVSWNPQRLQSAVITHAGTLLLLNIVRRLEKPPDRPKLCRSR